MNLTIAPEMTLIPDIKIRQAISEKLTVTAKNRKNDQKWTIVDFSKKLEKKRAYGLHQK